MIRRAVPEDAGRIAVLWNPWITDTAITFNPDAKTPADVARMIAERDAAGHATFLAEAEGRLEGFVTYAQFRGGRGYARSMEHTIVLDAQARGRGTGRALMATVEAHARAGGAHLMFGGISGENPAGRDFHLALGYALIATIPEAGFKFGRYMDLWLVMKRL